MTDLVAFILLVIGLIAIVAIGSMCRVRPTDGGTTPPKDWKMPPP